LMATGLLGIILSDCQDASDSLRNVRLLPYGSQVYAPVFKTIGRFLRRSPSTFINLSPYQAAMKLNRLWG